MKEGFRERAQEKAYGFAVGASIPCVLTAPFIAYLAVKGNTEAAIGIGQLSAVASGGMGLYGIEEFQGALDARRNRKALRTSNRMGLKERFLDKPKTPEPVKAYIRQLYEEWEAEALHRYDPNSPGESIDTDRVFLEEFNAPVVSGHLANIAINNLIELTNGSGHLSFYTKSDEERVSYIKDSDSVIDLLKFGWKVKKWFDKDGKIVDEGEEPYLESAVALAFMIAVGSKLTINTNQELKEVINVLRVPNNLRK